ncbi:hypothetical protein [Shinella sedimenti]|uniref:Uncharacterized protein n=1 Tax=Shinella sedimenti TaxID=2919913 RepID=A0ABT0CTG4_9HYPH|nr:hypothetical protein [Shinella sedimenti]MCJ8151857.1 hypothetical protein [Shinella sedimenti]
MGQESRQIHRFPCRHCGEDIVVALCIDYEKITHWVEPVENAEWIDEVGGAPIVNVDANFIVPIHQRDKDFAFPRMDQLRERFEVAEKNGSIVTASLEEINSKKWKERPFRRPDFEEEWKLLKTTWSLHRRGRAHLIGDRLKAASEIYYASDPLKSIQDWLWRFMLFFSQPAFEGPFRDAFDQIRPLLESKEFERFREHYNKISNQRGERYFELLKAYFESYDQFAQVHFDVVRGLEIPDGNMASSVDFDSVKMFYGNTFEALSSNIDIMAYFGNIIAGRAFDQFQSLTLKEYLRLDKPSRFGPLAAIPAFDALCLERDNQLRNASHHGGTRLDAETQIITFQSGKGGQGQTQEIGFAKYLARCDLIFLQMIVLFRLEIMMCQVATGLTWPI